MEFHYYYIIQDLVGLLMLFTFSRMILLNIKLIISKGIRIKRVKLLIAHSLLLSSGVFLCINEWSFKTWIITLVVVLIGYLIIPRYKIKEVTR